MQGFCLSLTRFLSYDYFIDFILHLDRGDFFYVILFFAARLWKRIFCIVLVTILRLCNTKGEKKNKKKQIIVFRAARKKIKINKAASRLKIIPNYAK